MAGTGLAGLGKQMARLFWGRVTVRHITSEREVSLMDGLTNRNVQVYPVRSEARIVSACFYQWQTMQPAAAMSWLGKPDSVEIKGESLKMTRNTAVKSVKLGRSSRIKSDRGMILKIPHTRNNRILSLKVRPALDRASLLALFSPIIQGMVHSSWLDKRNGKLMFLYGNSYNGEAPSHLALFRYADDPVSPLRWVWFPAQKGSLPRNIRKG